MKASSQVFCFFIFSLLFFQSCREEYVNPNLLITIDSFSDLKDDNITIDSRLVNRCLNKLVASDKGTMGTDKFVKSYYGNRSPLLWVGRNGVDYRADTLLVYIDLAKNSGLSREMFRYDQIVRDLKRIRNLELGVDSVSEVNKVIARLEYNLTRAYLKYTSGQYYGYVNPNHLLNKLCVKDSDSLHVTYFHLFDVPMKHASVDFYKKALSKLRNDSICQFLHEVQPVGKMFGLLCEKLNDPTISQTERKTVLCNIERCRWRLRDYPENHKKYVLVNVPAFRLYAVDHDSVLTMRIGCGTNDTKTPLLTSRINRMEINPVWVVPKSIAKNIVYRQGYLRKEHMYIMDRKRGKLDVDYASYDKVMSGEQYIVQEGGAGNSLGRIIFRFPNNHAVYLHDTSTPWFFEREHRAVSHGCVRVQKPFELAVFLLKEKNEEVVEKIKYSMTTDVNNYDESDGVDNSQIDQEKLIKHVEVNPEIPLFITYFTAYPNSSGQLFFYKDVYGYDKALYNELNNYVDNIQ